MSTVVELNTVPRVNQLTSTWSGRLMQNNVTNFFYQSHGEDGCWWEVLLALEDSPCCKVAQSTVGAEPTNMHGTLAQLNVRTE